MFVAYTVKIRGIIVCEDYNSAVSKILGDGWLNPRILSVQSLEAHHRMSPFLATFAASTITATTSCLRILKPGNMRRRGSCCMVWGALRWPGSCVKSLQAFWNP